jgi:hypothetical protein
MCSLKPYLPFRRWRAVVRLSLVLPDAGHGERDSANYRVSFLWPPGGFHGEAKSLWPQRDDLTLSHPLASEEEAINGLHGGLMFFDHLVYHLRAHHRGKR